MTVDSTADINATLQYLHWALIAAHRAADPVDLRAVTIELDLKSKTCTTKTPEPPSVPSPKKHRRTR